MKTSKREAVLPIGRTAKMAYEIEALRGDCSRAAQVLASQEPLDDLELEECARLDEALARAHRLLRATVRDIMFSRLSRRSRAR